MTVVANRTYLTRYARGREQLMTCFQRAAAGHPDMMTNDRVNRLNVLVNTMATIRGNTEMIRGVYRRESRNGPFESFIDFLNEQENLVWLFAENVFYCGGQGPVELHLAPGHNSSLRAIIRSIDPVQPGDEPMECVSRHNNWGLIQFLPLSPTEMPDLETMDDQAFTEMPPSLLAGQGTPSLPPPDVLDFFEQMANDSNLTNFVPADILDRGDDL